MQTTAMLSARARNRRNNILSDLIRAGDAFAGAFPLAGVLNRQSNNQQPAATANNNNDNTAATGNVARASSSLDHVSRGAAANAFAATNADALVDADSMDVEMMDMDDTANNNAPAAAPNPAVAAAQNPTLQAMRERFNPEGMRRASRAPSAWETHQGENAALIFHLYENDKQFLDIDFLHELEDVDTEIDYAHVANPRRKCRGNKTVEQRKVACRVCLLRQTASDALGPGGTTPVKRTVDFDAFAADAATYFNYAQTKVKAVGGRTQLMHQKMD